MTPQDTSPSSDPRPQGSGFCQQCGTPLTEQTRRSVGGAVFCEPCLAARIATPFPAQPAHPAYTPWAPGAALPSPSPNPRLAAVLGFIPGVGAMYNEQYAKGIAHLTIFALLVVLSDANGIFGLFIAGWEFYMAIEAYHTASARRDGTPLPNPFGFNDLGDRLGFPKGWTAPGRAAAGQSAYSGPASQPDVSGSSVPVFYSETPHSVPSWNPPPPVGWAAHQEPPATHAYLAPSAVPPSAEPLGSAESAPLISRFPAGAICLILLGIVFLLSTTGLFRRFSGEALLGWSLIGLAGWLLLRRVRERTRETQVPLRSALHGLDSPIWLLTSGILALLDTWNVLGWGRSWPVFIIVAGVTALLGRVTPQQGFRYGAPPANSITPDSEQIP